MAKTSKTEVTLEQAFEIGVAHEQAKNYVAADRTFRDILEAVPDHYDSLHHLGMVSYFRGNLPDAVNYIKRALEVDDSSHYCWNNYAIFLSDSQRYEEALKAWDKSLEINPEFPDPYSNKANTLWILRRFDEAEEYCRKAIELKPDYTDALLNLGNALASQDKLEEAVECWEKIIEIDPDFSNAYSNLGNAYRDLGKLQESEQACRKALELNPNHVYALSNLGNVVRDLGNPIEAEGYYRQAIALNPGFAESHNNLSVTLLDQNRYDEAVVAARYATTFKPDYAAAYGNLSVALRELGQFDEAEVAAQKAVVLTPESANAYIDLADILFMQDRFDEAEAALTEAQALEPDSARIRMKLSNVYERIGRIEDAMEEIEKAEEISPDMAGVQIQKANLLFMSNHPHDALECLNIVLEKSPNSVQALAQKSEIYQSLGDMEKSADTARKALELRKMPGLYNTIGKTKKFTEDDQDFKDMLALQEHIDKRGLSQKSALNFALFKAYQDIGDYEKAFECLKAGNDAKRDTLPYNEEAQKNGMARMKEIYTPALIKSLEGKGFESDLPVFIVGMPRSGTTLTEQIISSHPDVYGAGELNDWGNVSDKFRAKELKEAAYEKGEVYINRIKALDPTGKAKRITDKMPGNYFRLGEIVTSLPNAKVIHCRRNSMDTCLSNYKQSFARGQYWSYNLEELGRQYKMYEEIMEHWRKVIPDRFLEINYEETVGDLETQARKLINYIGLEWNEACLEPHKQKRSVMTASKTQVIKPVYKTSVEAWRRYEKQLQPLVEILMPEEALTSKGKKKA